jgi:hypothetical protein
MNRASYYREQADHLRELADLTWQRELEVVLRALARDYDQVANGLDADTSEIRHAELLGD